MHAVNRQETIITYDSGSPRDTITPFWESLIPGGVIGYGKDHMLGAGLGFIIGAKLARPEKFCINFMGDGALGQVFMNFETASRAKIPITTIVNNNGVLTWTKQGSPIASERFEIEKFTGDYSKVAEGLGGFAQRVERPEQIIPAVHRAKEANDAGIPALIEIMGKSETAIPLTPMD
jgi:acetolactate synthase-1/2/3 large subunit